MWTELVSTPEIDAVLAWHAALNAGQIDRLLELSTDDVEVGGPRGGGIGSDLLRDWVTRAGIRLEPVRWFARERVVVVEETAAWRTETGELGEVQMVTSIFRVVEGRVASVIRYQDLSSALDAAGLDPSPPSR
jgi:hypothetical protein